MMSTAASGMVHKPFFLPTTAPHTGWGNAEPMCVVTIPTTLHLTELKDKNRKVESDSQFKVVDYFVKKVLANDPSRHI